MIPGPGIVDAPDYAPVEVSAKSKLAPEALTPEKSVTKEVARQARLQSVPASVALAVASHLSGMRQEKVHTNGRVGLMAVDPNSVEATGKDMTNWRQNVQVGVTQLASAYRAHGNWKAAIGQYAGASNVAGISKRQRAIAKGEMLPAGSKGLLRVSPPLPGNPHVLQDFRGKHGGVDLAAQLGDAVSSITPGRVVKAAYAGAAGYTVSVRDPAGRVWSYSHLDEHGMRVGDQLKEGAQIGAAGATGSATNPHVHVTLTVHGKAVNPLLIIQQAYSGRKSVRVEDSDFASPDKGGASAAGYPVQPQQPSTTTPSARANTAAGVPPEVQQVPGATAPHPVVGAIQEAANSITASPETRALAARVGAINGAS